MNTAAGAGDTETTLVEAVARATVDHRHTTKRTTCPSNLADPIKLNFKGIKK
jgi:hypothetical protein